MKKELIMLEVPAGPARIAQRQTDEIVAYYARLASFGTLDLKGLALSCYLQGALDVIDAAEHFPNIMHIKETI